MKQIVLIIGVCVSSSLYCMEDSSSSETSPERTPHEKPTELQIRVERATIAPNNVLFVSPDTREYLKFGPYVRDIIQYARSNTAHADSQCALFVYTLKQGLEEKAGDFAHGTLWPYTPALHSYRNKRLIKDYFYKLTDEDIKPIRQLRDSLTPFLTTPRFGTRHSLFKLVTGCALAVVGGYATYVSCAQLSAAPHAPLTRSSILRMGTSLAALFFGMYACATGWNGQYKAQYKTATQLDNLITLLSEIRDEQTPAKPVTS